MRVTALSGGIGGARFLRGLLTHLDTVPPAPGSQHRLDVIVNTADDMWLFGLRVCPDLDTVMYTLGGGIDEARGWGRRDESWHAKEELAAYGVEPTWFGLGDRDLATHIVRTQMLGAGYPLSAVTAALATRWPTRHSTQIRLLPMSDDRAETHVVIDDPASHSGRRAVHFQEYWVRLHAKVPARGIVVVGGDDAKPAPGVLEAIRDADVLLVPPSNPVVSVGTILGVAGIRDAVLSTRAPVVGVSPIVANRPVRGMADAVLAAIGVEATAGAVARHYGARTGGGVIDGWLVDSSDEASVVEVQSAGIACRAIPLMMTDVAATAGMAAQALTLAQDVRR
ncbi:MAG: 2-phospho-L-lactate transferase [Propionibacteriales bacterium]|nr:2-phospho-L-lactate transferase [Propionibacteriales bacterium]